LTPAFSVAAFTVTCVGARASTAGFVGAGAGAALAGVAIAAAVSSVMVNASRRTESILPSRAER
jgi:hypothetical protein